MTAPIEDVSSLPGKKISDQAEHPVGEVEQIYATDGYPMWVAVELSAGIAKQRTVFIPLARIKDENGELDTPDADIRTDESHERLRHSGSAEMRQLSADQVAHNTQGSSDGGEPDREGPRDDDDEEEREGEDAEGWDDPEQADQEDDEDEEDEARDPDR